MYQNNPYGGYAANAPASWQRYQEPQTPVYRGEIINVNGAAGARSLRLAPNSSVILRDANNPIVWLCEADGTGYFEPIPYSVTPYQAQQDADVNDLAKRIARLEAMLNEQPNDDEPSAAPRRRRQQPENVAE